ncbi:hypothetical protein [Hydrogenophaga sp.]|uniref:hypothetical protein n=1 Tax=Hydrogenophaga sp. TaxID=1904254 RepID=UPI00356854EF
MNMHPTHSIRPLWSLLALGAALAASPVLAAGQTGSSEAQARYQRDVAACKIAPQGSDKAACLREAGAVRASQKPERTDADPGRFERNALKRCEPLPEPDRGHCVARIQGQGVTNGSVASGGIYRELTTREPVLPAPSAAGTVAPAAR